MFSCEICRISEHLRWLLLAILKCLCDLRSAQKKCFLSAEAVVQRYPIEKVFLQWVFREFSEILKNTIFIEHHRWLLLYLSVCTLQFFVLVWEWGFGCRHTFLIFLLRLCETHNALQLPVFFFFLFFCQRYPEYRGIRSKKIFYRPPKS